MRLRPLPRFTARTSGRWKQIVVSFLLLPLTACASIERTPASIPVTSPVELPTATPIHATALPSLTPTIRSSPTVIPCNPLTDDFCIVDGHFLLQRPIHTPDNDTVDVTYRYGSTGNRTRDPHHGVEFSNPSGTPVHAAADGTVIFAGPDETATYSPWPNYYGNLVVIEHPGPVYTLYAHLSRIEVQSGQEVFAGDKVGEVGRTGVAIGSHLHFEVRRGNVEDYFATQNPELWLLPRTGADGQLLGAIRISIQGEDGQLVRFAEVTVQQYDAEGQPIGRMLYSVTYDDSLLAGQENAAFGDLAPGKYRLVVQYSGWYHERWVEVESGRLTDVVFVVK